MPTITRDQVKVPVDVSPEMRETYIDNYLKATRNTGRLMLFACDQKVEHLNKDFYDGGEEIFAEKVSRTPFEGVFETGISLSEAERAADDRLMALICQTRSIPFGAEVPVAYLLAVEAENKNLRILLAGKKAGLDRDTILRRMRACYV